MISAPTRARLRFAAGCHVLLLPSMVLLLTFVYLPVAWAFVKSLYRFEIGGQAEFIGLQNYIEYLTIDPPTWPSMLNMFLLTAFAVLTRLTVPLVVAKLIHSLPAERTRYLYRVGFLVPIVVPGIAVQLLWSRLIYSDYGMLSETLRFFGLGDWTRGWLSDPHTALAALMFMGFPFAGGFEILVYYAGLSAIPESVNEAAALEGCTGIRKFFRIDVPLVLSQLKLILVLTVIGGFQGFEGIFVLSQGGPGFRTMVPGLWMYYNAFSYQRMGYACAIGVVLFAIIFSLTLFNLRYFRSAEEIQGHTS
ncbi:MAG: sugar ABC transporter permease [Verrucomicrobia bacterium]|nr:sugar ABC transporter permease [Verrucomicrobiota bacterium]